MSLRPNWRFPIAAHIQKIMVTAVIIVAMPMASFNTTNCMT